MILGLGGDGDSRVARQVVVDVGRPKESGADASGRRHFDDDRDAIIIGVGVVAHRGALEEGREVEALKRTKVVR